MSHKIIQNVVCKTQINVVWIRDLIYLLLDTTPEGITSSSSSVGTEFPRKLCTCCLLLFELVLTSCFTIVGC